MKNFLIDNIYPFFLFIFFFIYFFLWTKLNLGNIKINNNSLEAAIELTNYKPYLSYHINNLINSESIKNFTGYVLFPSLASVAIFSIFKKILSNDIWSLSLTLLSITSTENFPFIKFIGSFFNSTDIVSSANFHENFEIMGFPIPSVSIFIFCLIFYSCLSTIKLSVTKIFTITFLWSLMIHIHPVDGFIGNCFWVFLLSILYIQNRTNLSKKNIFFIFLIYVINIFIILSQLDFQSLKINSPQTISFYHIFFYFISPSLFMSLCFYSLKIDFYEFFQKFLNIYLLMFVEIFFIILSLYGFGFELQMLENRISMFLLHYLYYLPPIYYLCKDEIFYINNTNKGTASGMTSILLYYCFNKYKNIYLMLFVILIFLYLGLSLNIL